MADGTLQVRSIYSHDYSPKLRKAVSWLGDRYLLATPQPRRAIEHPKYWTAAQHAAAHESRTQPQAISK